jgi:RNase P protein component
LLSFYFSQKIKWAASKNNVPSTHTRPTWNAPTNLPKFAAPAPTVFSFVWNLKVVVPWFVHAAPKAVQDSVCNQLLRTRPLASTQDGQLRLHGRLLIQAQAPTAPQEASTPQPLQVTQTLEHALYLIVPKKRYRYAVDRNRVKRVVRAQLACVLGEQALQYQWVFRTPANKAKGVCLNPQTQAFTAAIVTLLEQARQKIAVTPPCA